MDKTNTYECFGLNEDVGVSDEMYAKMYANSKLSPVKGRRLKQENISIFSNESVGVSTIKKASRCLEWDTLNEGCRPT